MADHNTPEGKFRRRFGGVAIGAALAAYLAAPLVQFANPAALAAAGGIMSMGLVGLYNVRVVPGVQPFADKVAWVFLVLGAVGVTLALVSAGEATHALDGYCAEVQQRMIAAERMGKDVGETKDVLQTLRCRPQAVPAMDLAPPAPATAALPDAKSGSAVRTQ